MLGASGTITATNGFSSNNMVATTTTTSHTIGNTHNNNNGNNNVPLLNSATTLSSQLAAGISNGYASAAEIMQTHNVGNKAHKLTTASFGGGNRGKSGMSGSGKAAGGGNANNAKLPDISRRKIRERLIHLLALRPFKKPELYMRLQNEGLRERERPLISNILKDISTISRDNTFNLKTQMWNDVNENWPFYTEQELQLLKRRKPQNLTPPFSSDAGSSTSGHSPTSVHTGSPPPLVGAAGHGTGLKRTSLESERYDAALLCGVQPKKTRISHCKKDAALPYAANNNQPRYNNTNGQQHYSQQQQQQQRSTMSSSLYNGGRGRKTQSPAALPEDQAQPTQQQQQQQQHGTDLSYNVLDNVDEFMPHMQEQSVSSFFGNSQNRKSGAGQTTNARKTTANNNNKDTKDNNKRSNKCNNSSSSSSSSSNSFNNNSSSSNSSGGNQRRTGGGKATAISPKPYANSFVPESSLTTDATMNTAATPTIATTIGNGSKSTIAAQQQQQLQQKSSPNYAKASHAGNSVIYSPKRHQQQQQQQQ